MRRFLFAISVGLFVGSLAILFASSSASALDSAINETITLDQSLLISESENSEKYDFTTTYMGIFNKDESALPSGYTYNNTNKICNFPNNAENFGISVFYAYGSTKYYARQISLYWSTSNSQLNFAPAGPKYQLTGSAIQSCNFYLYNNQVYDSVTSAQYAIVASPHIDYIASPVHPFLTTFNVNYPEDYAGATIPDSWTPPEEPDRLRPDYSWSVSTTGELRVTYLKNLSPFLTGYSTLVLDKMTNDWESVDERIGEPVIANPAGWMDETTQVPEAGYYMFNVSHNQQLDSPPWPADANKFVDQVWVQFYWDGKTAVSGTTVGSKAGEIVNDLRDSEDPLNKALNSLQINTFGLTNVILMPINFISTLPNFVNNCSPISLPIMGQNVSLECMRDRYQAWSPTVWAIWQTVVTAVVAFGLSFNLFRIVKNINTPHNDGIEMAKL